MIDVSMDANITIVCINMAICSFCLIYRLYQKRKYKRKATKFMCLGVLSIIAAVLFCGATLAKLIMRYYDYKEFPECKIAYVSTRTCYALHRAFLYAFVVWKIEVVNTRDFLSRTTIRIAKIVVVACSIFLVLGMIFFVEAKSPKKRHKCMMGMNVDFMVVGWTIDIVICVLSSWLFLRPILRNLKSLESYALRLTVEKEAVCISICLLSTIVTAVLNYSIEGIMGITIGIDCSITSCCLVVLATPVNPSRERKLCCCVKSMGMESSNKLSSMKKTNVEIITTTM